VVKKGKWLLPSKNLVSEPDTEWEFIDGSCVKVHQHSAGARGSGSQAIDKSRAGNTTKFMWQLIITAYRLSLP
jgi:hypothetical protein